MKLYYATLFIFIAYTNVVAGFCHAIGRNDFFGKRRIYAVVEQIFTLIFRQSYFPCVFFVQCRRSYKLTMFQYNYAKKSARIQPLQLLRLLGSIDLEQFFHISVKYTVQHTYNKGYRMTTI